MITITDQPELFFGVNNPIHFLANTDNLFVSPPYVAERYIDLILGSIAPGNTITLTINGTAHVFTFVSAVPGNNEIAVTLVSAASIAAGIAKNREIFNWFTITSSTGPDKVHLVAKNFGSKYSISFATNNGSAFSSSSFTNGSNGTRQDDFKLVADIFIEGISEKVGTYEAIPNTDFINAWSTFYIENVIKPHMEVMPPKALLSSSVLECDTIVRKISMRFYERFLNGSNPLYYNLVTLEPGSAFAGGISFDKWSIDRADLSNDYFETTSARKFLSLKPLASYIGRNEQNWLYLWCGGDGTGNAALQSHWTVYYKDGTSENKTLTYAAVLDKVAIIPAYLDAITGLAQSLDNVLRATLYVSYAFTGGGTVTSEVRQYDLKLKSISERNIQIKNSIGGYDSWLFTGGDTTAKNTEGIQTKLNTPSSYLAIPSSPYPTVTGTDRKSRLEQKKNMKLNSGWLDKNHADWLLEEIGSVVLVFDVDRLVEWTVTDKSIGPVKDIADMHEVSLTIEQAFVTNRS
jgi:hypothetical protein